MQEKNIPYVKNILLALASHVKVKGIRGIANYLGMPESSLYSWISRNKIGDTTEGKPTDRIKFNNVPFNLQKNENLIYLFNDVPYYEEKVKRSYVGGYAGVSIKIAKGIYYKTGAFKGHPVETSQMVNIDNGCVGVTTKHIYFAGGRKSFRAPFTKIINLTPYTDGIGIHLDNKTAKPQILKTGNGWFIYNLVQNLSQM